MTQKSTHDQHPGNGGVAGAIDTVADKAKEYASNASEMVDHARDKVQEWAHNAKDKMKDATPATGEMATSARDKAQEIAATAIHDASASIHTAGEELTRAIRKYPVQSVLLGAALGYLLVKATSKG